MEKIYKNKENKTEGVLYFDSIKKWVVRVKKGGQITTIAKCDTKEEAEKIKSKLKGE